ncbi:hypothetical protein CSZ94_24600 [Janthinobacterium sp. ROICE36]|uniref:hypothetical protein n=1 Tax=Janthinobacterium sp. ROICE36 TaxID=2048670 RepID=UPI000C7F2BFC|nr:hypothetical protein [Janthinobacterium sp. ROICE36]PLY39750.1 hypothetical protein CSZ94_24600 [Janthinobacterium sp. ROICE36]
MISVKSAAVHMCVLAGSLLCAAAYADTPPAPAAESRWQDSLPPAPPVAPREEKILPRSEWLSVEPMKAPDRRCDPGLDALFLSKECGKEPSWLGSRKK